MSESQLCIRFIAIAISQWDHGRNVQKFMGERKRAREREGLRVNEWCFCSLVLPYSRIDNHVGLVVVCLWLSLVGLLGHVSIPVCVLYVYLYVSFKTLINQLSRPHWCQKLWGSIVWALPNQQNTIPFLSSQPTVQAFLILWEFDVQQRH